MTRQKFTYLHEHQAAESRVSSLRHYPRMTLDDCPLQNLAPTGRITWPLAPRSISSYHIYIIYTPKMQKCHLVKLSLYLLTFL